MSSDILLNLMRHSCAHLMAAAVQQLFPDAKFGVGPVVENGFYYDIDVGRALSPEDLDTIEKKMRELAAQNLPFEKEEMKIEDAIAFFEKLKQPFKVELLKDLKEKGTTKVGADEENDVDAAHPDIATIYKTGDIFIDLCRGPHVSNTGEIGAFKLDKLAGAYWRGKETNPMLTRVYGLCFETQEELDAHLKMMEEAKKRDHRKLGRELDLFAFSDLVGPGLPLFTPRGYLLRRALEDFVWSLMKPYGYERVWIPHMAKSDLYKTSGHWDKFADDIFHVSSKKSDEVFVLKPMNCPHHTQIYASSPRSWRALPLRLSEVTTVYRDENTGQLAGLSRVRSITQDDAHIFCTLEQVKEEANGIFEIISKFYAAFGMSLRLRLSVNDPQHQEKYLGEPAAWEKAVNVLRELIEDKKQEYELGVGEAAFYGPKIDFMAKDAIGREWQLATIQIDFNQPERFGLEYAAADGTKQRPVMIHRAISGSLERFISVLIEHYAGAFPLWLAPVQVRIASVGEAHVEAARALVSSLKEEDIRAEADTSDATVGAKIREASRMKVPYTIVFGDKEAAGGDYQIRVFGEEKPLIVSQDNLISAMRAEVKRQRGF